MRQPKRPPMFRPDGTIEIRLTKGRVAVIDACDAHLAQHNWRVQISPSGTAYALRVEGGRVIMLHREVLGLPPGRTPQTDHRDGDGLNCRRGNLRPSTPLMNARNNRPQRNNTSGHLGVSWAKRKRRWRVTLGRKVVGMFKTLEDAVEARLAAERAEWGVQPRRAGAHALGADPNPTGYGD